VSVAIDLPDRLRPCLEGAYDLHVHGAPDVMPRKADDFELARTAREAGLGGFVLKSHHVPTADRATLVRQIVPGIDVLGSITLNHFVGGLNAPAVEVAARLGARVVWLPTVDAANEAGVLERDPATRPYWATIQAELKQRGHLRPPIAVVDADGRPVPELLAVLEVVRDHRIALATGHLNPSEIAVVVRAAYDLGIRKVIVTHPEYPAVGMTVAQQQELVPYGAIFERAFSTAETGKTTWEAVFAAVRATGPAHNVISTDLGQPHGPLPAEGFALAIRRFAAGGFDPADIRAMTVDTPRRLATPA
jgi:hypothetical protein